MSEFIRDDAEALMQYGNCPDMAYEAHRISQHEEAVATSDDESFNELVNYFLSDWSGL